MWVTDLLLVGIGVGLVVLGTLQGGRFGDGEVVGVGAMSLGAGVRGLITGG